MTAQASRRALVRRLGRAVGWALLIGLVVLGWPSTMGGCTTLTIVTGHSMEPTLHPGDLAITRCGSPQVGDVVSYRPFTDKSPVVIHRIIGGDATNGWELQGDNNHFIDPFKPVAGQVTGVMVAAVPRLGAVMSFFTSPLMWVSLLLLAAALALWPAARPTPSTSTD